MPLQPAAIIDTLNGLLEAEINSVFRAVRDSSPYVSGADAGLRALMDEIDAVCHAERRGVVNLIESLGGTPRIRKHLIGEEQYLSYLSLKFLLPKLVNEKDLMLTRFENARATIGPDYPQVIEFLTRVETDQTRFLGLLKEAAGRVTGGKFTAPVHGNSGSQAAK